MQETVCLTPAPAPSSLVTDADAAQFGERSARRVRARLQGDLDAIVLRALAKEPERRYASVAQLSADLERHLDGLPVSAQRDRLGYRAGKFLRRRRVEVAAASLVVAALVGAVVVSTRQASRAELERAKMEQVNEFLASMLSAADPDYEGRDVTVVSMLSRAAADIDAQELHPEIEAQIRHTLAQTYYGLGHYDSASVHAQRAWDLRREVLGEAHQSTLYSLSYVAGLAEARGDYEEAERLTRGQLVHQRRTARENPADLANALDGLARQLSSQGRLDEAMEVQLESIEIRRASSDSASREGLPFTLNNLAVSYNYKGDFARSEALMREALQVEEELHGTATNMYGNLLRGLASVLDELGRTPEADSTIRESMRVLAARSGEEHPDYLRSAALLASIRFSLDDMPGVVEAARKVTGASSLHESDVAVGSALQLLGLALDSLGQYAAGDSALRRSLEIRKRYLPEGHWAIASSEAMVGVHLGLVGEHEEAERIIRDAYARIVEARGADAPVSQRLATRMAELLERVGRADEAKEWRARS